MGKFGAVAKAGRAAAMAKPKAAVNAAKKLTKPGGVQEANTAIRAHVKNKTVPRTKKYGKRVAIGAAATGATVATAGSRKQPVASKEQAKAKRADKVSTAAGLSSLAMLASKKTRGKSATVGAVATGAALVAAHHVAKRDSHLDVTSKQKAKNVAKAAVGFGVEPSRAQNKGRSPAKSRAQSKSRGF